MSRRGRGIATAWGTGGGGTGGFSGSLRNFSRRASARTRRAAGSRERRPGGRRVARFFGTHAVKPHATPAFPRGGAPRGGAPRGGAPRGGAPPRGGASQCTQTIEPATRNGFRTPSLLPPLCRITSPFSCKVNEHAFVLERHGTSRLIYRSRSAVYHTRKFKDMPLEPLEMEDEESFKKRCTAIADYVHQRLNNSSTFLLRSARTRTSPHYWRRSHVW